MTTRSELTDDEWRSVLEGPTSAGLIVITAARGGMFRETIAMSKAYAEARAQHGQSALLDDIVSTKPKADHTRYSSMAEVRENGLRHVREAVAVLQSKATAEEVDEYRRFVVALTHRVAAAHREHGQDVSPAEQEAIDQIAEALGTPATAGDPAQE
ncbi:hypothetical protein [Actinoplanes sp. NPDC026623]|uniref:hypothetical protein n=1 Tax=Actinoplanes sp. NPDC026623 TaxID=3155610 RepID=UPI0033F6A215